MRRLFKPRTALEIFKEALTGWLWDDVPALSAALAYHAILSMAPLLILLVGAFSLIFGADVIEGEIVTQVQESVGEKAAQAVQHIITSTQRSLNETLVIGVGSVILLVIFATGAFNQLIASVNIIWGIKADTKIGLVQRIWRLVKRRFLAFLFIVGIALYLYASIGLGAIRVIPERYLLETFPAAEGLLPHVPLIISPVVYSVLFAILFKILPDAHVKWRNVWCGAIVTGLLFVGTNRLIALYLQKTVVTSFYGAAGSFIVVLLWIYWSANVFLFGAEMTKACTALDECDTRGE